MKDGRAICFLLCFILIVLPIILIYSLLWQQISQFNLKMFEVKLEFFGDLIIPREPHQFAIHSHLHLQLEVPLFNESYERSPFFLSLNFPNLLLLFPDLSFAIFHLRKFDPSIFHQIHLNQICHFQSLKLKVLQFHNYLKYRHLWFHLIEIEIRMTL